ncbi:MAG: anti-sigma factor domain-containing protein [Bacillota bacterium]|nr:anti-sigma factor domain-containing protein [Bacillota bacterium]
MKKGIIMEIDDEHLTLLTPDGEFLRSMKQNKSYSIGEEILFTPFEKPNRNYLILFKQFIIQKPLPVILTALLLFIGSFLPMYQNNKAYAYMSIDVNPSIELGVNNKMEVVKLTAFNHDGESIISNITHWKSQEVSQLTQSLIGEMKKEGFLKKHHSVIISTVRTEKKEDAAEKKLTENLNEIEKVVKENHLEITVLNGTKKEMQEAHQLGITTGKYQETKLQSSIKDKQKSGQGKNSIQLNKPALPNNQSKATPNGKKNILEKANSNKTNAITQKKGVSSQVDKVKGKVWKQNQPINQYNSGSKKGIGNFIQKQWKSNKDEHENEKSNNAAHESHSEK